jgi:hypothetical protein
MRHTNIALLALAAIALTAPALADEPAATTAPAPAKPPKPKKICRMVEASSTSRIGSGRACRTAEEWDVIDAGGAPSTSQSVQSRSVGRD